MPPVLAGAVLKLLEISWNFGGAGAGEGAGAGAGDGVGAGAGAGFGGAGGVGVACGPHAASTARIITTETNSRNLLIGFPPF